MTVYVTILVNKLDNCFVVHLLCIFTSTTTFYIYYCFVVHLLCTSTMYMYEYGGEGFINVCGQYAKPVTAFVLQVNQELLVM